MKINLTTLHLLIYIYQENFTVTVFISLHVTQKYQLTW